MTNPAREHLRCFVGGLLCGLALMIGAVAIHDGMVEVRIQQQYATTDRLVKDMLAQKREGAVKLVLQGKLNVAADRAVARTAAGLKRLPEIARHVTVIPAGERRTDAALQSDGDTTDMVRVARKIDITRQWNVPKFLMDERMFLLELGLQLDSALKAERRARLYAVDTLVPDLRRQLVTADSIIGSQRRAIELHDRARHPRCGRRCGVVLGVAGTVLAAVAVDQVQQLTRRTLVATSPR